ncbi:aminotransferase class V-fold PLP-dependent enzyme [soil metagenome]
MSNTQLAATGLRRHWTLDPDVTFLNHGSFGAAPRAVLETQAELRVRMEREPVRFLDHELEERLDLAREPLAELLSAQPQDLAWLPNATTGVNSVAQSLEFAAGDEILTTDHEYNAVLNTLAAVARRHGARVVVAQVPFPLESADEAYEAVIAAVTQHTRLAVISHVTSPTALRLPVERLVPALAERGIDTLIDGAHAPGMLPLDLEALGAAYYTGNCHKWLCAPKGAGFLHVRHDRQDRIRPLVVSHGANSPRKDRSRYLLELDWTGTDDPTAYLSVPAAIDFLARLLPGGFLALMAANHELAIRGRDIVLDALGTRPPAPDEMLGSMAAMLVPADLPPSSPPSPDAPAGTSLPDDPLHDELMARGIQVPVHPWPGTTPAGRPRLRLLRISAGAYNEVADYASLAAALGEQSAT